MTGTSTKNTRSNDFRQVYANTYNFQFNGIDLVMKFGILHELANPSGGMEEQVSVIVNLSGMKTLALFLSAMTDAHEAATGTKIPLSPETQATLAKIQLDIDAARARQSTKP